MREIYLPVSLREFNNIIFSRNDFESLETIYYAGTEEQWNSIAGKAYAMAYYDGNVVYNYAAPQ